MHSYDVYDVENKQNGMSLQGAFKGGEGKRRMLAAEGGTQAEVVTDAPAAAERAAGASGSSSRDDAEVDFDPFTEIMQ